LAFLIIAARNLFAKKSYYAAIVPYQMQCDALNSDIYIFISNRRKAIKLLFFEGDGFALFN